jgi:hypothetical protein
MTFNLTGQLVQHGNFGDLGTTLRHALRKKNRDRRERTERETHRCELSMRGANALRDCWAAARCVLVVPFALPSDRHDVVEPCGSLSARRALAAALMFVEMRQTLDGLERHRQRARATWKQEYSQRHGITCSEQTNEK